MKLELRLHIVFSGYPGILQRHYSLLRRNKRDCDTFCDLRGREGLFSDVQGQQRRQSQNIARFLRVHGGGLVLKNDRLHHRLPPW